MRRNSRWRRGEPAPPESTSLVDVLKATVSGDAEALEQLAVQRGRERARKAAEAADERHRRSQVKAAEAFILRAIRTRGAYMPNDWR
ncbi:MAG: hypothetical protein ACRD3C_19500 [Vicinamibacterales bacterium]